jgi:stage V sporulation protein SpoVS
VKPEHPDVVLRVSGRNDATSVRNLTGAVMRRVEDHGHCVLQAIRENAIGVAIKVVASVNFRIHSPYFLVVPSFASAAEGGSVVMKMLVRESGHPVPEAAVAYRVSCARDQDDVDRLSRALVAESEKGLRVGMECMGISASSRALMAACDARGKLYLRGKDAIIVPRWRAASQEDRGRSKTSVVLVEFWARPIQTSPSAATPRQ